MQKWLIIPDCHIPYHSKPAWALLLRAARVLKPDRIVALGDFADCASISHHSKDPSRIGRFASELGAVNQCLDDLESLGAKQHHYIQGNHEHWLERLLMEKAPELCGLDSLTWPVLLGLQDRGWTYTPYRQHLKLGRVYFTHETGKAGANAHQQARATFESNVVIGHTHRLAIAYSGNAQGKAHVGAMFGWLGDVTRVEYAHRVQALRDWQLGFGTAHVESNGTVHLQAIPIINGKCVVEGKLIK